MPETSAGLLLYRRRDHGVEVFVVHPGGPFFAKKDEGAWTLPKGLVDEGEDPAACARREFEEETGQPAPAGDLLPLGEVRLKSGKRVIGFAAEGDADADAVKSNLFTLEWPPRSGKTARFPEVDRALWLSPEAAKAKLNPAQGALVDRLMERLVVEGPVRGSAFTAGSDDPPRQGDR